jgi:hypothetical protein
MAAISLLPYQTFPSACHILNSGVIILCLIKACSQGQWRCWQMMRCLSFLCDVIFHGQWERQAGKKSYSVMNKGIQWRYINCHGYVFSFQGIYLLTLPSKAHWSLYVPPVWHSTILRSAHTVYLWVLCGSENKQRLFPYTTLTDWFLQPRRCVFTARYGLSLYIIHVILVFTRCSTVSFIPPMLHTHLHQHAAPTGRIYIYIPGCW